MASEEARSQCMELKGCWHTHRWRDGGTDFVPGLRTSELGEQTQPDPMALSLQIPMSVPHAFPHHVALCLPAPMFLSHSHGTFGAPTHTSHCLIFGTEDLGFLLQALSGFSSSFEKEIRVTSHREALSHFLSLGSS